MYRWILISAAVLFLAVRPATAQDDDRIELEIGEDTTFFTGPVNDDGTIDYVAALNAHYDPGVAAEDNAFAQMALLHPAIGADQPEYLREYRDLLFLALGIEHDPDAPRFVDWIPFAAERGIGEEAADEMYESARSERWQAETLPDLADWLEANEPVVDLLSEALTCETYFSPLIRMEDDKSLISVLLPQLSILRRFGKLIEARMFYSLATGDHARVVDDLLLLHRMGAMVSHEITQIGKLVGISIQNQQCIAIEAVAEQGTLEHRLAARFLSARSEIPIIDSMAETLALLERCISLDLVQRTYMGEDAGWEYLWWDEEPGPVLERIAPLIQHPSFDVNRALRHINWQYDKMMEYSEILGPIARQEAYVAFDMEISTAFDSTDLVDLYRMARSHTLLPGWTAVRYTDSVNALLQKLMLPALGAAHRTQDRANTRRRVESTAIALLGYRDVHGVLPESLDALVPTYFDAVPIDLYTDEPLVYRVNADGSALVYSIGGNFEDDGGVDDYAEGDIAIRIGPPPVE